MTTTMATESVPVEQQQGPTLELYRKALTYNVIGKYDPKIKHLITHTYHSTIFQYEPTTESWNKLEIEGVLALYSRSSDIITGMQVPKAQIVNEESYTFGLIILNRLSLENFSIGLIGNSNISDEDSPGIKLEVSDGLVIVKNLNDETFGIWIHDETIRDEICKSIEYIIEN